MGWSALLVMLLLTLDSWLLHPLLVLSQHLFGLPWLWLPPLGLLIWCFAAEDPQSSSR